MASAMTSLLLATLTSSLSLHGPELLRPALPTRSRVLMAEDDTSLRELVRRDRLVRKGGIGAGATLFTATVALGGKAGVDMAPVVALLLGGGALAVGVRYATYLSNQETQPPCPDTWFTVAESPGKGSGLFATCDIAQGTYLFDYLGEVLDEDGFFARYPNADGRYIAGITDDYYIDGELRVAFFPQQP
jgi:hypothetical protein